MSLSQQDPQRFLSEPRNVILSTLQSHPLGENEGDRQKRARDTHDPSPGPVPSESR